ncbi:PTTG1 interacting protein a [Tachysurus fulvidraco]|uniref:PTTG1 interacting protein a n=1 Tax=Tachysurus fulvidraco TaxID=1234273 RepID=UPI000F51377E|nr:PTTG1 interacting protein a [Tachysurus fulvidraco]
MDIRVSLFLLVCGLSSALAQNNITCENSGSTSCEQCLTNVSCLWCITSKSCITYPYSTILPPSSVCPLNDARWGQCMINFQTLIITLSVLGAIIIIAFLICLFRCCKCENCGNSINERKMQRKAEKRTVAQEQRRTEMMARHDEIRQKYGLSRGSAYAKFDNSA